MKVKALLNDDNCWASQIFRKISSPASSGRDSFMATIHHVVRDGSPQIYWFAFWKFDTGFIEFDIRDLWRVCAPAVDTEGCADSYRRLGVRQSIEYVASFLQRRADDGLDVVDFVKRANALPIQKCKRGECLF